MIQCPHCSFPLPDPRAKFCPRCGRALPADIADNQSSAPINEPIRLEKRGSLINPFFIISAGMVIAGTIIAGEGSVRVGLILLGIGLPLMVLSSVLSLGGKI